MQKIIVVLGPTGVGKTSVSVQLAKLCHGAIINSDSRQIYRELNIGSAKPTESEFQDIPHYLFNHVSIADEWNAALFAQAAEKIIHSLVGSKITPIIVGGNGLYIQSLLHGLFLGPQANPEIRGKLAERIETEGLASLYAELKVLDPDSALKIHAHDRFRIIRALEVFQLTGRSIHKHHSHHQFEPKKYDALKIGLTLPRARLYATINVRVLQMISDGLEGEVRALYQKWGEHPLLLKAIGYQEWPKYFSQEISKEALVKKIQQNSRRLAKRQWTWFRRDKEINWYEPTQLTEMEQLVKKFIIK